MPAWLAVVTYRDARQKDERVFETTVQIQVTAVNAAGESQPSAPVSVEVG